MSSEARPAARPAGQAGKRVVVTAAADGIGKVIAEAYLGEGARVAICDIRADKVAAFAAAHPAALAEVCDVADEAALGAWMERALAFLGGCDTLVNNAGIAGPTGNLEEAALDQVRLCLEVGLVSHFLCAAKVLPGMKAQGSGLIVNLSSAAGLHAYPRRTPYAAAKWAVVGLSKSLAAEVGAYGVRVNAVCPGSVSGARMDRVIAARAAAEGRPVRAVYEETVGEASLRTFVTPEDIAGCVLYLDGPAGCRVSGQALAVDGHLRAID